jgi:hypothetical protein
MRTRFPRLRSHDAPASDLSAGSAVGARRTMRRFLRELRAFPTRAAAALFLFEEKNRLENRGHIIHTLHLPDDCPCYRG